MTRRTFTGADLEAVEPWFDDPETRRRLGDRSWPRRLLRLAEEPGREAYLFSIDGVAVALLDCEHEPGARTAFAIVVAPERRCEGIGRAVIEAALELPGVDGLVCGVEDGNEASRRCAVAAGLVPVPPPRPEPGFTHYASPPPG